MTAQRSIGKTTIVISQQALNFENTAQNSHLFKKNVLCISLYRNFSYKKLGDLLEALGA